MYGCPLNQVHCCNISAWLNSNNTILFSSHVVTTLLQRQSGTEATTQEGAQHMYPEEGAIILSEQNHMPRTRGNLLCPPHFDAGQQQPPILSETRNSSLHMLHTNLFTKARLWLFPFVSFRFLSSPHKKAGPKKLHCIYHH